MKRNWNELRRKLQLLLISALAVYPIHWVLAVWRGGALVGYVWLFSLGYVAGAFVSFFLPGKLRVAYGAVLSLLVTAGCIVLSAPAMRIDMILQLVVFVTEIMWSLQIAGFGIRNEIPALWISLGVPAHLMGQILLLTDLGTGYASWSLSLAMYLFVLLTMLSVNRKSLLTASGKRGRVSLAISRRNGLLVLGLFLIGILGSLIPSALTLVKDALVSFIRWIGGLLEGLMKPLHQGVESTPEPEPMPQVGQGVGQVLELHPVLETIILYIGAAISVAMLLFVLYRVGRKIVKALAGGFSMLGQFLSGASEDYVDEVSDTRETGSSERVAPRRRIRTHYREDKSLPPAERIRRRFLYLKLAHPEWSPGSTAREMLPETAASIYERARYSPYPTSEEDARAFLQSVEDV